MDNHEISQVPVGAEGATSSQDNTQVQVTQPEAPQAVVSANAGDQATGSTQPWESDERFKGKSAEDVWNAYQEAQKVVGQASQKAGLVNELEEVTGMSAPEIQQFIQAQKQAQVQQQMQENPAGFALQRVQELENQLSLQNELKEVDSFVQQNPEYAPFKDKILNLGVNLETSKSYAQIAKEYFGGAIAQGQESAYKKIDTKQKTQIQGNSTVNNKGISYADMKDMPRADRLKAFEGLMTQ